MAPRLIADRYQLLREVSRAPDASYWQAADTLLDRQVMLELLRPELADDPGAVERFRDALRVTARAGASAHGRLLDGGTDADAGLPFAVFEWDQAPPPVDEPRAPPQPPPSRRPVANRPHGRNVALPILLMALPLALGVIVLAKFATASTPSVGTIFAVPTAEIALTLSAKPVIATPTPAPAVVRTAAPTRAATPAGTPTATSNGERVRVANTDGIGVALRDAPGGQRLPGKGYDEGATVTVLERRGEWAHIRGDDGREGWVLAVTVPPAR